jgi:hypothetical protein
LFVEAAAASGYQNNHTKLLIKSFVHLSAEHSCHLIGLISVTFTVTVLFEFTAALVTAESQHQGATPPIQVAAWLL